MSTVSHRPGSSAPRAPPVVFRVESMLMYIRLHDRVSLDIDEVFPSIALYS